MIDPTRHRQLQELNEVELCVQILNTARNELYLNMRFLDVSLSSLGFEADPGCHGMGTDGRIIYYNPGYLLDLYRKGRVLVNRTYLHLVLHCLFCHMYHTSLIAGAVEQEEKDGETGSSKPDKLDYWNLACDIAMESVIDDLYKKCVHVPPSPLRRETYLRFRKRLKVLTAEGIYKELLKMNPPEKYYKSLVNEFRFDDHTYWLEETPPESRIQRQNQWNDNREKMQTEMESLGDQEAEDSKSIMDQVQVENRERYDYKLFLKKFSVLKEELQVDEDSFDYAFYTYGLSLYGNMPLIEPLESKEIYRIEDFVIVIDTSMSCSGELVLKFLEETYSVLCESESYFRKINIHIIQCDDKIQSDQVITSREEMEAYRREFTVKGQGGTDFRPAFEYVNQLMALGRFKSLRGLIYFTDGQGIYPVKKPVYDTAFVFVQDHYSDVSVPAWAIKLILDIDDIGDENEI